MPARCWIAPEMPLATYSCGETVLPVWPTWNVCGIQPESTAAREAPTAAPSASARPSTGSKLPPVPRPPETTIAASVSSGRPVALPRLRRHDLRGLRGVGDRRGELLDRAGAAGLLGVAPSSA